MDASAVVSAVAADGVGAAVPDAVGVSVLEPLFAAFKTNRTSSESFGDFCTRAGNTQLLQWYDEASAVS
jgi:sulfite reductase beta subunit-like hemoprotein